MPRQTGCRLSWRWTGPFLDTALSPPTNRLEQTSLGHHLLLVHLIHYATAISRSGIMMHLLNGQKLRSLMMRSTNQALPLAAYFDPHSPFSSPSPPSPSSLPSCGPQGLKNDPPPAHGIPLSPASLLLLSRITSQVDIARQRWWGR